nr:potassium channel family protein [Salsipaludibacter albus]
MVWAGWSLVFLAGGDALVSSETGARASGWDAVYFAGYTITTLGVGHLETVGDGWKIAEVLASMSGFVLASLGISFVISVVNAVVDKRSLAADLHALGATPIDVARNADGLPPAVARTVLEEASSRVHHLAQQHLAYPVLHYFHSSDRRTALAPSLAVVDEGIELLRSQTTDWPDPWTWARWDHARTVFLGTLQGTFVVPAEEPPRMPGPATDTHGDDHAGGDPTTTHGRRRALLVAFTSQHGWDWESDVLGDD